MKLSVKSDYAVRAVLGLARVYGSGEVRRVDELAAEQGVSANYLVQILLDLKSAGLVRSQRGKEGGYRLALPPAKVTFASVLRAIHGELFDSPALNDPQCPPALARTWRKLKVAVEAAADGITFQDLLEQSQEPGRMYYI